MDQVTLLAIFEEAEDLPSVHTKFEALRKLVVKYKNVDTMIKRLIELEFGIQDVMNGLIGIDRHGAKILNVFPFKFEKYS